jgi:bifunctional non-homologous end joining protein LigD
MAAATAKQKPSGRLSKPPRIEDIEPQLATLVDRPPSSGRWIYEIKFDGYRLLARIEKNTATLRSRNNLDWSNTFPAVRDALQKLKASSAVLDGELCYVLEDGRTSFQRLQKALPRGGGDVPRHEQKRLVFYIFDVLFLDGVDVSQMSLLDRKDRLKTLLGKKPAWPLAFSDHFEGDGHTALGQACQSGLEGLIAKRADAPYASGRNTSWLKLKCHKRQEFVIVGMLPAEGARIGFRSLLLASREGGQLKYNGKVGTGFDHKLLRDIGRQLQSRVIDEPAVTNPPRIRNVIWVKPDLVCEVEFTEMTEDGSLRHPSFQGLRQDKPARQVVRESATPIAEVEASPTAKKKAAAKAKFTAATAASDSVDGVRISHPDRVIDPKSGLSKGELARYHEQIAEWMLPYADNRPLALVRCPQGNAQQCFFQKQKMTGLSEAVRRDQLAGHEILYTRSARGLIEMVQFNAIEFHGWGSTMADPDRPDWIVMDLDPDVGLPFSEVVDAALELKGLFEEMGLTTFVKTTGGKGLHVVVPLTPEKDWDTVKGFTHALAQTLEAHSPQRYVATVSKAKRTGKIFVDYLRNGQGATAVLPYSSRARPGATVAMPVAWKDIQHVDPREFDVRSAVQWVRKRRKDPWAEFFATRQKLPDFSEAPKTRRRK